MRKRTSLATAVPNRKKGRAIDEAHQEQTHTHAHMQTHMHAHAHVPAYARTPTRMRALIH
eukprot:6565835-Alexandrium_andersonii.AAC.1